jgi:hypothetical protein
LIAVVWSLTQAGNLKPVVVAELMDQLQLDGELLNVVRGGQADKEQDIWPLHKVRIVCMLAGLLKRRGQQLEATRKAERLIKRERAGELYELCSAPGSRSSTSPTARADWPEPAPGCLHALPFAVRGARLAQGRGFVGQWCCPTRAKRTALADHGRSYRAG